MPYTKPLRGVAPILRSEWTPEKDEQLVWLMRESFQREAEGMELTVVEWRDMGELDPSEVSPQTERETFGRPAADYKLRYFEGLAGRAEDFPAPAAPSAPSGPDTTADVAEAWPSMPGQDDD
ncbi:hypothetical protein TPA4_23 [Tsukamurella phage TPA4]|uniref:minor tail protein n=1 Tax=Tsukamurella phage TPA4 TaxID=1647476 RepID=UPI0007B62133|nr:minor tail protein [Tsukamurella phage TPA4]AKJ72188.1 hypothetical protein TPA4_23 [Tsukamurella phage TPA4]